MDFKKTFEKFDSQSSFIRVSVPSPVESPQKALLNRKGNQKFNEGNVEVAKKIFMTTGYSDGLSRVGDYYKSQSKPLEALRMYWMAPDRKKTEPIIEQIAYILQSMIHEDEETKVINQDDQEEDTSPN
jgi:hypothetical protein